MINGTITLSKTGTSSSGTMYGQILWSAESNGSAENTSTVTVTVQVKRQAGFTTTGTWKGSATVGTTTKEISWYGSIGSSWVTIATITETINHAHDGNGNCYIYAKVNGPSGTSQSGVYVSGSETITLEKIARFAEAIAFADFNDEANPIVQYSNPAGSEIESLEAALSIDGSTALVSYRNIEKAAVHYTFALTTAERKLLLSAASKSNTLDVYVLIRSSINGTTNVSVLKSVMTVVNAAPDLSPKIVDTNSSTIELTGNSAILVALHSVVSVKVNATAKKQSTIEEIRITNGVVTLTADGTLTPTTGTPITITVTDSRGNTTTYTAPNKVVPYIDPISTIENSMPTALGELDLIAKGMVFDGSFGAKTNAFSVKYRVKEGYGSFGSWVTFDSATLEGNAFTAEASITGLDYQKAYTFQVAVYDSIHPEGVLSAERKFVSVPVFDWSDIDFKFNVPVSAEKVTGLSNPTENQDAVNKQYLDEQLGIKQDKITGGISTVVSSNFTKNRAIVSNASGKLRSSSVTDTELEYLSGVSSSVQTQLDSKVSLTKLWTNASPTSSFAAQTITISTLADYTHVGIVIDWVVATSSRQLSGMQIYELSEIKNNTAILSMVLKSKTGTRGVKYNGTTGLVFEGGYQNDTTNNSTAVPYAIYGIKGVT